MGYDDYVKRENPQKLNCGGVGCEMSRLCFKFWGMDRLAFALQCLGDGILLRDNGMAKWHVVSFTRSRSFLGWLVGWLYEKYA